MRNMQSRQHRKRIVVIPITMVITLSMVIGLFFANMQQVEAKATLPGIETIVMNNSNSDPFVILEVLPNKASASLGYLVGGEEPINDSGKAISDMPSKEEREEKFTAARAVPEDLAKAVTLIGGYTETIAEGETENVKTRTIYGSFEDVGAGNGNYDKTSATEMYKLVTNDYKNLVSENDLTLYRKYVTYAPNSTGELDISLKEATSEEPSDASSWLGSENNCYNYQYFAVTQIADDEFFNAVTGDMIFLKTDETWSFAGVYSHDETSGEKKIGSQLLADATAAISYSDYYIVNEADSSDIGSVLYSISSVNSDKYSADISYGEIVKDADDTYSETMLQNMIDKFYILNQAGASEFTYKTDGTGSYSFQADYTQPEVNTFQYINGFTNYEWFKQFVFDLEQEEFDSMVIDVVPVTMEELNAYDLSKADLIYFAGGDTAYRNNAHDADADIYGDLSKAIVNAVISENFPVIIDSSTYSNSDTNLKLKKMLTCLMQKDLNSVDINNWDTLNVTELASTMKEPLHYMESGTDELSYVNQSIFINDDAMVGAIANSDFNKKIDLELKLAYGFSDVLSEIDSENFYLELAGKEERIAKEVSKATAIRYIINYGNKRAVSKNELRVLDLEPYDPEPYLGNGIRTDIGKNFTQVTSIVTDSIFIDNVNSGISTKWLTTNLASNLADKSDQIYVNMMGTKEFIGKQEDLNEEYDLIYIGMDTSIMNTSIDWETKSNDTCYNDSSMNGLVYSHIGDTFTMNGQGGPTGTYRMSGNDITYDKLHALTEYVEAGYALLLSDDFFMDDMSVNTDKLDVSSNLYKFVNEVVLKKDNGTYVYFGKNVNKKGNMEMPYYGTSSEVTSARETFSEYLNISKLVLSYSEEDLPLAYNKGDGTQQYLTMNSDGKYTLDYNIILKNDSAVSVSNTSYDVSLYLDSDADGKFEEEERLTGLSVTNVDTSSDCGVDGSGKYNILAGYKYHISRNIPDGYTGFVSWKLVFSQNDRVYSGTSSKSIVRKSISGFSAVPTPANVPTIRVLQIVSAPTSGYSDNDMFDLTTSDMQTLYSQVKDFNIEVEQITASDYINKVGFLTGQEHFDYLCDYNMIIMGFRDKYDFSLGGNIDATKCKNAILAIREYALSGRSILFTHDLNSHVLNAGNSESWWGYYANLYLRDVQGMDRYGNVAASGNIPSGTEYQYSSVYDNRYLENNEMENVGYTDTNLAYYMLDSTSYGTNARRATYNYDIHLPYNSSNWVKNSSKVEQINAGQITQYPFYVPEEFEVSHTHPQYYQLNLDTDSMDDNSNDDVVVWYTIGGVSTSSSNYTEPSDSYYRAVQKDVRNTYYIYSKGNVTYTGCGDSKVTDQKEKELFVNTMVASYNSGIHAPTVIYKESQWDTSADINGLCIPFDAAITLEDGNDTINSQKVSVNFKTINNNLRDSSKPMYAQYYIEDSKGNVKIGSHTLRSITPSSFKQVVNDGTTLSTVDAASDTLSNFTIYTMQFTREELGLSSTTTGVSNDNSVNIIVRLSTKPFLSSTSTTGIVATESLNELNIIYTELVDLE